MLSEMVNFRKTGEKVVTFFARDYIEAFLAYHSCRVMIQACYRLMFVRWLEERDGGKELIGEFTGILQDMFKDTTGLFPEVEY